VRNMDKKFIVRFVSYWIVNTIIISFANTFFPNAFELGNANLSIPVAGIFSGFLLTIVLLIARGLARSGKLLVRGRVFMFLYYWGSASIGIWLVARVAGLSGFGIARFTWAIGVGFATAFIHWVLRQAFKGMKLYKS
jgi:hypothetical protein